MTQKRPVRTSRPAKGVAVKLHDWASFEDRGIPAGAVVWADPDEPPLTGDLVLELDGPHYNVCLLDDCRRRSQVVGPIVWVEPEAFEPPPSSF